jgi:hypothetical protein
MLAAFSKGSDNMKRVSIEVVASLVVLAILFFVIFVGAGFFGATLGVSASATAPDFHLKLANQFGLVCPARQSMRIDHSQVVTGVDAYGHNYAGQNNDIYCTDSAGVSHELDADEYLKAKLATIGLASTLYTLVCFVPLFLPLGILALIAIHKIVGALLKPGPASQAIISG